jgi:hypothetical protein
VVSFWAWPRVKDTIQRYWFDCDGLLREAEKELATAF